MGTRPLGGEIGIESEPGVGSMFWFTVCLNTCPVPPQALTADALVIEGKRVLCVGDHMAGHSSLKAQLEAWGINVDVTNDVTQAITALQQAVETAHPYDLALLHHHPPDLDGMALASQIRRDATQSSTRLVLLSRFGQRGHGEAAQRVGLSAYLVQPVQPSQLYACLGMVLSPFSDPSTLVTRHRVTEARAHLATWILVAAEEQRQKAIVQVLQTLACRVDVVADHAALREALAHRLYAYLVIDLNSPAIDAVAVATSLRASPSGAEHLPIIAIESSQQPGESARWLDAGLDAVRLTPLQTEAVLGALKALQPARPGGLPPEPLPQSAPDASDTDSLLSQLQVEYGPELASELCHLFLAETPDVIATLRRAWCQGDGLAWQQALLRLQSSCHSLGARALERLCLGGAQTTEIQETDGGDNLVEQLEIAFRGLQRMLENQLNAGELNRGTTPHGGTVSRP